MRTDYDGLGMCRGGKRKVQEEVYGYGEVRGTREDVLDKDLWKQMVHCGNP